MDSVIEVVEHSVDADGSFQVRVHYPADGADHLVRVTDPGSPAVEELLAWYFEQHLRRPFLDGDRRRAAVVALGEYGRDLFAQVFAGEAGFGYQLLRRQGFDGCRIEVVGSAVFHHLHWEAMLDPALNTPVALRVPITRRVERQPIQFELAEPRPTLNILVVTARPDGARDVGYRTISRPLVAALRQAELPVTIEVVRPGTWQALRAHLEAARAKHKGTGWYQLVHFDVHGSFADHTSVRAGAQAGRYTFANGDPTEFEGKRGFLFFETDTVGKADPRTADDVAKLLAEYRVPMAVLNACQSAMQTSHEAALAQQLVEAGVPMVVGMAYSVTVTAAALAMPVLYEHLTRGDHPEDGLRAMRRTLADQPERRGYFDQTLPLDDWVLPVAFRQRAVDLALRPMQAAEEDSFDTREALVGDEPAPEYGFVGRDLDVQGIERMLLTDPDRNQVLVKGMAGAGKSTLLQHLGWWWKRTGLIDQVFAFSFEDRAWTCDQIVREIATRLWPGKVEFAIWDSTSETVKRERVAKALRTRRHLLVIDNLESATAAPAAIPHALPEPEREALREWVARLRAGKSLVVFGSREPETWLATESFGANAYELGGLDPQAASVLADRILDHHHATGYRTDPTQRQALDDLLKLLDGYPLPLEVVLPTLANTPPTVVLEELGTGGAGADPVGLIQSAIEYSHAKLDPTLQTSLALLAPFTAVIPQPEFLADYQQLLAETEPEKDRWGQVDLAAAVEAAVGIGLAAPHEQLRGWVRVVPILPYFLRQALQAHPSWWQAARTAHYRLHASLGQQLQTMLTGTDPGQRATARTATTTSYANLTTALDTALDHELPVLPVLAPVQTLLDQTRQQTAREHLLQHAITRLTTSTNPAIRQELPHLLHRAGMVAQEQRRFDQAEDYYRQALDLKLEFGDR
ncbi:CHAT domain-containing protein, partial [Nocardia jiangsuensis]